MNQLALLLVNSFRQIFHLLADFLREMQAGSSPSLCISKYEEFVHKYLQSVD